MDMATGIGIIIAMFAVGGIRALASTEAMDMRKPIEERMLANTVARICEAVMAVGFVASVLR